MNQAIKEIEKSIKKETVSEQIKKERKKKEKETGHLAARVYAPAAGV